MEVMEGDGSRVPLVSGDMSSAMSKSMSKKFDWQEFSLDSEDSGLTNCSMKRSSE